MNLAKVHFSQSTPCPTHASWIIWFVRLLLVGTPFLGWSDTNRTVEPPLKKVVIIDIMALNNLYQPSSEWQQLLSGKSNQSLGDATSVLLAETNAPPAYATNGFPCHLSSILEAFTARVIFNTNFFFDAPTHVFGSMINIIPYGDGDAVVDATGHTHYGDEYVSMYYPPGEIGFAIKHHRPFHRVINLSGEAGALASKDEIKLQDTHIEMVVGVMRDGHPGVVTVNNPQSYQAGGFGDESEPGDYPMIFTKPAFPKYLPRQDRQKFVDNIRTMMIGFNTVSRFPNDYDGGDPLSASTPEKIEEMVKMMIKAVAGNAEAQKYFEDPENYMYCAELAFIATSAGLLVPLNEQNALKIGVTKDEWQVFKQAVELHNKHLANQPSFFVRNNENSRIALVDLADLDSLVALKALPEYAEHPASEYGKLAFKPETMPDIVDGFLQMTIPRRQLGENVAPYQAKVLNLMKPGLLEMLNLTPDSPNAKAALTLYDEIVTAVGKQYSDYGEFRKSLQPLMEKARHATVKMGTGVGLFTPPSLFHLVLKGVNADAGLIGLDYVGNGVYFSVVKTTGNQ